MICPERDPDYPLKKTVEKLNGLLKDNNFNFKFIIP